MINTEEALKKLNIDRTRCHELFPKTKNNFRLSIEANRLTQWYEMTLPNGERLDVEITYCDARLHYKKSLMNLWVKHGYLKEPYTNYWSVSTYHSLPHPDTNRGGGRCYGDYNPQIVPGQNKINFKWILPASMKNRELLLAEIERRAMKDFEGGHHE